MKLNSIIPLLASAVLLSACAATGAGKEHGYVTSIPQTVVEEQVHRVNIQRVNGKQPIDSHQYYVPAGTATVRVSLILDEQWAKNLRVAADDIYSKEITLEVEDGMLYQLGGKVDTDASDAAQRDGSFWQPVVYRKDKR